jgi:caffeoyl-CoA O-methyltransferase
MSATSIGLSDALQSYVVAHSTPVDDILRDLAEETRAMGDRAAMQIAPEQGTFLTLVARLIGARRAVEVGTFTGYSSICIARGLAEGGRLLCCDVSEEWTAVARRYWTRAGLTERIELRIAPAHETLSALPTDPDIDLAFLDADKTGYPAYWEQLVPRMRPGGVLLVDNVLSGGRVVQDGADDEVDEDVAAIKAFNDLALADDRVELVLLPLADGVTFAVKH